MATSGDAVVKLKSKLAHSLLPLWDHCKSCNKYVPKTATLYWSFQSWKLQYRLGLRETFLTKSPTHNSVPSSPWFKRKTEKQRHRRTNELIRQVGKEMKMHKREEGQQDTGEEHKKGTYKQQHFQAFECNDTLNWCWCFRQKTTMVKRERKCCSLASLFSLHSLRMQRP